MGCSCSSVSEGPEKEDIRDRYKIGKHIGSGAFGQVRDCWDRQTGDCYAVKIMEKYSYEKGHWSNQNMFKREVAALSRFSGSHPNIINYIDFYEDRHFFYAIMEKCYGGELFDQIVKRKRFTEKDCVEICRQMLRSIIYVHSFGIAHRDIKAENFLFKDATSNSVLKLIDFGMCCKAPPSGEYLNEVCGSPHYLAPELIKKNYGILTDVWAFGVIVYLMLFGQYPYDAPQTSQIIKNIIKKDLRFPEFSQYYSSLVIDFIKKILCKDPTYRLSATQALAHPWLQEQAPEDQDIVPALRSARRKITESKPKVAETDEQRRDALLERLDKLWASGHKVGFRVYGLDSINQVKPEFKRRENRTKTAPSRVQQDDNTQDTVLGVETGSTDLNEDSVPKPPTPENLVPEDVQLNEKSIKANRPGNRAYTVYAA